MSIAFDQNNCFQIKDYLFSNSVKKSCPPIHKVKFPDGTIKSMKSSNIFRMLQLENITGTRFDEYADYIKEPERDDININDYFRVGEFLISKIVLPGIIPNHFIVHKDGRKETMDGVSIYRMLRNYNLSHPTIENYSAYISSTHDIKPIVNYDTEKSKLHCVLISDECMESYPCQHCVTFNNNTSKTMDGLEIYLMLMGEGMEIPKHFQEYKNFPAFGDDFDLLGDY